jgi:glyoxylase-like metal-dependent hydrolase (beta-lactamase superfamily II)
MDVGALRIEQVMDGTARFPASDVYVEGVKALGGGKGAEDDDWSPHRGLIADDGMLELALGGFLVRHGDTVALVDTGVGLLDAAGFQGGMLIDNLAKLGVAPDDVTDVLFTHLHFDHVGWATSKGAVVFPNATYRCHEHDWEPSSVPTRAPRRSSRPSPTAWSCGRPTARSCPESTP